MEDNKAMTDDEILEVIREELSQSVGGGWNDNQTSDRERAESYYVGDPAIFPHVKGRSSIVSTDLADAVEWAMPKIVEAFLRSNQIVKFDPTSEEDGKQAEIETEATHRCLWQDNDGFIVIHTLIKDCLLARNGNAKVYYEERPEVTTEHFTGMSLEGLQMLLAHPESELLSKTDVPDTDTDLRNQQQYQQAMQQYQQAAMQGMVQAPPPQPPQPAFTYDVKIKRTTIEKGVKVVPIKPEEFRISRQHDSINPKTARFCAHVALKTKSELLEEGVPKEVIDELPTGDNDPRRLHRYAVEGEHVYPRTQETIDDSQTEIDVSECYLWIDTDGDGIAEFKKIRVAGDSENAAHILDMVDLDPEDHPFCTTTSILQSHKHFGISWWDRLKQIQDHKTSLFRNIQDNIYLQNNQRIKVGPGANIDDMLTSRPGGLCRMNSMTDAEPLVTPPIGQAGYQMLDYLDTVMSGRVGVSPDAQMKTDAVGSNVGSEGVNQLLAAKDELLNLMIRVIAETGIKPIMLQVRSLLRKHVSDEQDFKFRDEWMKINPAQWSRKRKATVRVGTGTGNDGEQQVILSQMLGIHEKLQMMPGQALSGQEEIYNTVSSLLKINGINNVDDYIKDPTSPRGQQASQEAAGKMKEEKERSAQLEIEQLNVQKGLVEAEIMKAQAQGLNVELKGQVEALKLQLARATEGAAAADKDEKIQLERDKLEQGDYKLALEDAQFLTQLEVEANRELNAEHRQNMAPA